MKKIIIFVALICTFSIKLNAESLIKSVVVDSELNEDVIRLIGVAFLEEQGYSKEDVTTLHLKSNNDKIVYDTKTNMVCEDTLNKEFQANGDITCSKYTAEINLRELNLAEGSYDVVVQVQTPKEVVSEVMYVNVEDGFKSFSYNNMRYDFGVKDKRAYINVVNQDSLIKTDVTEFKVGDNVMVLNGVGYLNDIKSSDESDLHQIIMLKDEKGDVVYKHEAKARKKPIFMWLYSNKLRDYSAGFFESGEINLNDVPKGDYEVWLYVYDNSGNYAQEQLYTSHIDPKLDDSMKTSVYVKENRLFVRQQ